MLSLNFRIKRLELNFKENLIKSIERVSLPESFISILRARNKFLLLLPENFVSPKFRQKINKNIESDPFYNYYLKIINYRDTTEDSSPKTDLITQLKSQLPENQCEIENYLQSLQ